MNLKESIESSGVELIFDTEVEEKIISCDKYDIERCVINLVSNDQKFIPKDGGGLGLTITKHIIDLHGGSIYVESEKNEGCKFTIILPVK